MKEEENNFNLEQLKLELRDKTLRKLKMFDYRKDDERVTVLIKCCHLHKIYLNRWIPSEQDMNNLIKIHLISLKTKISFIDIFQNIFSG